MKGQERRKHGVWVRAARKGDAYTQWEKAREGRVWVCVGAVGAEGKRAVGLHWSPLNTFCMK